jgi:hypothetical protein
MVTRYVPVRITRSQKIHLQPSFSARTPAMTGPKLGAAPVLGKTGKSKRLSQVMRNHGQAYKKINDPT